jgi:hypothetical protein
MFARRAHRFHAGGFLLLTMAGASIDLVEADFLGIRGGRIQSDRAGDEGKAQKAFPVGAGAIEILPKGNRTRIQDDLGAIVPTVDPEFFRRTPLKACSTFVLMALRGAGLF